MINLKSLQVFTFQAFLLVFIIVIRIDCNQLIAATKAASNVNRNFIHILQSNRLNSQSQNIVHFGHHNSHHSSRETASTNTKYSSYSLNDSESTTQNSNTNNNNNINNPSQISDGQVGEAVNDQQIFINQSNNIHILAKYGQTVSLPCIIYKQKHHDLSNIHAIWNRLYDRSSSRPVVLSVGIQQLKQDMRYRVKKLNLSRPKSLVFDEPLVFNFDNNESTSESDSIVKRDDNLGSLTPLESTPTSTTITTVDPRSEYLIENWQFEIRKLTYEDAGTYQCSLPLLKPISKNIKLQVIPDLTIEPKDGNFKIDDKIVLKCKATMGTPHKTQSSHLINQRQSKSSILWYRENEIIKATSGEQGHKIEIETKLDNKEQTLNSILTVNSAKVEDSGKYRCIYDNTQEQINIKVINDFYEYKNYLSSSNSARSLSASSPLSSIFKKFLVLMIQIFLINQFLLCN